MCLILLVFSFYNALGAGFCKVENTFLVDIIESDRNKISTALHINKSSDADLVFSMEMTKTQMTNMATDFFHA